MIVNPEKFQVIITDKKGQNNNPTEKNTKSILLLLGLKLCNKSADQLTALNRLNKYLGFEEKNY